MFERQLPYIDQNPLLFPYPRRNLGKLNEIPRSSAIFIYYLNFLGLIVWWGRFQRKQLEKKNEQKEFQFLYLSPLTLLLHGSAFSKLPLKSHPIYETHIGTASW